VRQCAPFLPFDRWVSTRSRALHLVLDISACPCGPPVRAFERDASVSFGLTGLAAWLALDSACGVSGLDVLCMRALCHVRWLGRLPGSTCFDTAVARALCESVSSPDALGRLVSTLVLPLRPLGLSGGSVGASGRRSLSPGASLGSSDGLGGSVVLASQRSRDAHGALALVFVNQSPWS
jgi:hypothetical protein